VWPHVGLDPEYLLARPAPNLQVRKIVVSLTEPPIFQIASCTVNGSHIVGPRLTGEHGRKNKTRATHTATENTLARSTATSPNFHIKRKRAALQRA
jgi:hypothetical protein